MSMEITIGDNKLKIRNATRQDYKFCYGITKRHMKHYAIKHLGQWSPSAYRGEFDPEKVKVLTKNNNRLGYYMVTINPKNLYIDKLQISGLIRGKGVGTKLLELIERKAKKLKKKSVQLHVFTDNPSKNLYKRLGYKTIDKPKKYLLLMGKDL